MCVVDAVVHDGGGHVLAGVAECPCGFDVEIESRFAASLTDVFLLGGKEYRERMSECNGIAYQVPLILKVRIAGRCVFRRVR